MYNNILGLEIPDKYGYKIRSFFSLFFFPLENFQITSVRGTEIGGFTLSFVGFQIPGFGVYKSWGFIKGFMSQGSEVLSLASVFA